MCTRGEQICWMVHLEGMNSTWFLPFTKSAVDTIVPPSSNYLTEAIQQRRKGGIAQMERARVRTSHRSEEERGEGIPFLCLLRLPAGRITAGKTTPARSSSLVASQSTAGVPSPCASGLSLPLAAWICCYVIQRDDQALKIEARRHS